MKNNDPNLSRREFLTSTVGAGGAMLLGPTWLNAAGDGVDPRAAQVISGTIGRDGLARFSPCYQIKCPRTLVREARRVRKRWIGNPSNMAHPEGHVPGQA